MPYPSEARHRRASTTLTLRSHPVLRTLAWHQPQPLTKRPPKKPHTSNTTAHTQGDGEAPVFKGPVPYKEKTRIFARYIHTEIINPPSPTFHLTPKLQYLHCRLAGCGQAKVSSPAKQELPVALRSKPAPGPTAPYSRRGPGANDSMQSYIATRLGGKLGARTPRTRCRFPLLPRRRPALGGGGGGLA